MIGDKAVDASLEEGFGREAPGAVLRPGPDFLTGCRAEGGGRGGGVCRPGRRERLQE